MSDLKGVIYILTNPSFPEYVKIGYARDIQERIGQLNRSESIPFAFRAYAIYEVDAELKDKDLHKLIDKLNPDLRAIETIEGKTRTKEFYAMSKEAAYELLECIAKISGTERRLRKVKPTGKEIAEEKEAKEIEKEAKRGPFRFSKCNIPLGSKIFFQNKPDIAATVLDDRHILYNGETTSLSALAESVLKKRSLQGPKYFTYEGKTLVDIRNTLEANNHE